MRDLIKAATVPTPAGLVVSLPNPDALAPPLRAAERAGIPVISMNSGSDAFARVGALLHVGEGEYQAGYAAGRRLRADDLRRTLCVIHEVGNAALEQALPRLRGRRSARTAHCARTSVLDVNLQRTNAAEQRIAAALRGGRFDGLLTLGGAVIAGPDAGSPAQRPSARQDHKRHVRHWPAGAQRYPRRPDHVCRRPAAISAGLPADRAAHSISPLRRPSRPREAALHRAGLHHQAERRSGAPAQQPGACADTDGDIALQEAVAHFTSAASAGPDSSALAMKPRAPQVYHAREVAAVVAGCEHDRRGLEVTGQAQRDFEPVHVRKLYVEQDDRRPEFPGDGERRGAIGCLTDDVVAGVLENATSATPKARVVVDDQYGLRHRGIVASDRG